jgi:hypothetical protein
MCKPLEQGLPSEVRGLDPTGVELDVPCALFRRFRLFKRRDAFGVPLDLKHVGTQFEEQDVPQSLTVNTAAEDLLRVDYLKADFHIGIRTPLALSTRSLE